MVAAEEERMKEREADIKQQEEADKKKGKKVHREGDSEHGKVDKSSVRAP